MKWINNEEGCRYTDEFYELRCKQTDILPLKQHYDLNDILLFHKIVYNLIPVTMPIYIYPCHGASKLRSSYLDYMSYVFSDATLTTLQTATISFLNPSFIELYIHGINCHWIYGKSARTSNLSWKLKASFTIE